MQLDSRKEKLSAIIGTGVFHLLVILFLLFYYIKPGVINRSSDDLEGVPVMFGNVADAYGDDEPFGRGDGSTSESTGNMADDISTSVPESSVPRVAESAKPADKVTATQDMEKTIALKEAQKLADQKRKEQAIINANKKAQLDAENKAKLEAAQKAKLQADQAKNINNQTSGAFGNGTGSGSRGNTSGTGTQGVATGNASYGKTSGIGGNGTYDLGGRSVGSGGLAQPSYTVDDYGTVVVDIVVDPKGNVIEATIGKRTNTTNASLLNEAQRAAKRTKFNTVNTLGNQKGTITYKFNLN